MLPYKYNYIFNQNQPLNISQAQAQFFMQDHLCPQDAWTAFVHQLRHFWRGGSNFSTQVSQAGRASKAGWPSLSPFPAARCSKPGRNSCWMGCAISPCSDVNLKSADFVRLYQVSAPGGLQGRVRVSPGLLPPQTHSRTHLRLVTPLSKGKIQHDRKEKCERKSHSSWRKQAGAGSPDRQEL